MDERARHTLLSLSGAVLLTLPWVLVWATGAVDALSTVAQVVVSGAAVLGASFLLAWGAETAERDVPRAFALAVLAVLAVAPEYAVDALYAWQAGADPANVEAANLAVANMTGANRILIGLGWSLIALFSIYRARTSDDPAVDRGDSWLSSAVELDPTISTEILFLSLATVYAFFVPVAVTLGAANAPAMGIDGLDMVVLVGLYATYIFVIVQGGVDDETEHVGVPAYLQEFDRPIRVSIVLTAFAFSGFLIFTAVEPFAHGLEVLGESVGVPSFFMIQWIAPLASESPELIVTAYLVNKARSTAAFNALISSKLNQWTLLVGTLVFVYSLALGRYGVLPFAEKQALEIWLTAAQSFFALAILVNFRISVGESVALLVLFVTQVVAEFAIIRLAAHPEPLSHQLLLGYTVVYLVVGAMLFVRRSDDVQALVRTSWRHYRGRPLDRESR
ncbi:MAG: sodium:calcium antiporter [Haloarculaceae archaeon]